MTPILNCYCWTDHDPQQLYFLGHYSQSFSIGGGAPLDTKTAQELERRKWIQELGGDA